MGYRMTRVAELKLGDQVDLENDAFADPNREHIEYEFEYQTVAGVIQETPECVCVYFEGANPCGFPTDYKVRVAID